MPVKIPEREYRLITHPLAPVAEDRAKRMDSEFYVEGYATTFDDPYVLWGDYSEAIDRHALDGADMSDVIFQYDHGGKVLARQSNGSLIVTPDDHGLFVAADLSGSKAARDLYEEITAGLVTRMSWAFTIGESDRDGKLTTIRSVKRVYDVSAVSIPANDATEISARAYVEGVIDAELRESQARRARVLRIKTRL